MFLKLSCVGTSLKHQFHHPGGSYNKDSDMDDMHQDRPATQLAWHSKRSTE
jgi:hypothetical protein